MIPDQNGLVFFSLKKQVKTTFKMIKTARIRVLRQSERRPQLQAQKIAKTELYTRACKINETQHIIYERLFIYVQY